jgi:hypothetical protein
VVRLGYHNALRAFQACAVVYDTVDGTHFGDLVADFDGSTPSGHPYPYVDAVVRE